MDTSKTSKQNDFKTPVIKSKRRSSFFGIENHTNSSKVEHGKELEEFYIQKLTTEKIEWSKILTQQNNKLRDFWRAEKDSKLDASSLSKERREFLAKAIDIPSFIEQCNDFCKQVDSYIIRKQFLNERYLYCLEFLEETSIEVQANQLVALETDHFKPDFRRTSKDKSFNR